MAELLGNWAHVVINTLGSWLPGEATGFRDHDHRVHSSGTVEHPSPREHEGLHRYSRGVSSGEVSISPLQRMPIAESLAEKLISLRCRVRIISVSASHAHILADVGPDDAKPLVGRIKQASSHRVRATMPGRVWSQGCFIDRLNTAGAYRNIANYIARHEDEGAAIWVPPKFHPSSLRTSLPS